MAPFDALTGVILSAGLLGLAFGQALWRQRDNTFLEGWRTRDEPVVDLGTRDEPFVEGFGCALMWAGLLLVILAASASAVMHLSWNP